MSQQPSLSKIAVLGTEGAGKTVLIVTMASRLSGGHPRYFLEPKTLATKRFVRQSFDHLNGAAAWPINAGAGQLGTSWLPSTDPGTMHELEWRLHVDGIPRFDVRIVDAAGQDFRRLFGEEAVNNRDGLLEAQRQLMDYVVTADILLVTVNLGDFVGEVDADRRESSEWTSKFALDRLCDHGRQRKRILLVFTQQDRYVEFANQQGGWLNVAKTYLSDFYLTHLANGRIGVMGVAAVNETELSPDSNDTVPKPGFTSAGLEELVDWVAGQSGAVADDAVRRETGRARLWKAFVRNVMRTTGLT